MIEGWRDGISIAAFFLLALSCAVFISCTTSEYLAYQRNMSVQFQCECGKRHFIIIQGDEITVAPFPGDPPPRDLRD